MSAPAPARLFEVDPLVQCRPATAGQRVLALLVDAPVPLVVAAAAVLAFAFDAPGAGAALVALALVLVGWGLVVLARTGRSPGRRLAATRTVERQSGVAAGSALMPAFFNKGGLVTVDLRSGRDPHAPALPPLQFPEPVDAPPVGTPPSRVPVAVLDSGERLPIAAALVLGRKPSVSPDAPADLYQWPDLSRTLSKSHARLEWDGERMWAIDLGSTNGTLLLDAGVASPLLPFQRTVVGPGAALELGERRVMIERVL